MESRRSGVGDARVCETCLSTDRRLAPLSILRPVYVALVEYEPRADPRVCWECAALLRRAAQFRLRALRAQAWLLAAGPPEGEKMHEVKPASSLIATEPNVIAQIHSVDTELTITFLPTALKQEEDAEDSHGFDNVDQSTGTEEDMKNEENLLRSNLLENADNGCSPKNRTKRSEPKDSNKQSKKALTGHCKLEDTKEIPVSYQKESLRKTNNSMKVEASPSNVKDRNPCKPKKLVKRSRKKRNCLETDGPQKRGRPRVTVSLFKISGDDVWRYRKEELEREYFRTAKYKCEPCLKILSKSNYAAHMQVAHGKETWQWQCEICGIRRSTKSALEKHVKVHYELFGCFRCSFKCLSKYRMRYHVDRVHKYPKEHQCSTCNLKFTDYMDFLKHLKEHKKRDNYYECDKCSKKFKTPLKIVKHLKSHELNRCTVCDYSSKSKYNLDYHFLRKHAIAPVLSEVYCVECNKQYYTAVSYENHLSTVHTPKPDKKVSCPECNKTFRNDYSFKCHNDLFHLKKTRFHCEKCNKYFYSKSSLQGHKQSIHDGLKLPKTCMCNICGRGFSTNRILNNHIRTHTGERPFECQFCSAAFAQNSAMKIHQKKCSHAGNGS